MMTNNEYAKSDPFLKAVKNAAAKKYPKLTILPTSRQASKYRMGRGIVWRAIHSEANTNSM